MRRFSRLRLSPKTCSGVIGLVLLLEGMEVERCSGGLNEVASVKQASSLEIADSGFQPVAFPEILKVSGHFAD